MIFGRSLVINGHQIQINPCNYHILFLVDSNLRYTSHVEFATELYQVAANKSNVFCLDSSRKMSILSTSLEPVTKPFAYSVPTTAVFQLEANEENLFICYQGFGNDLKLRILSINSGVARKEFKLECNGRLKLVADNLIVLFNSHARKVYFYDQNDEFSLIEEAQLRLEENLSMSSDVNGYLAFYEPNNLFFYE